MAKPHTPPRWSAKGRPLLLLLATALLALLALAPSASAFKVISENGEAAGRTNRPTGLAVNYETGRLYGADTGNNRVDVFGPDGSFEKAFGWGVKTGESAFEICVATCRKGIPGEGSGQFGEEGAAFGRSPTEIAVDSSSGDVYVVDLENQRVEKFDEAGNFILMFGGGVDKTVPGNVCTAASGHVCGAGTNGFGEGEFLQDSSRIFVGVGPDGSVYVVDSHNGTTAERKFRLQRFEPSGASIAPQQILQPEGPLAGSLAVDSTGNFYIGTDAQEGGNSVLKYELGSGASIDAILEPVQTLGADPLDHIYAAASELEVGEFRNRITEYDPSGNPLRRFGYGLFQANTHGLAPYHSATGDVYASEREGGSRVLQIDFPEPGPVVFPEACKTSFLGNTKATLSALINPEGKATTFHFEYITEAQYLQNGSSFTGPTPEESALSTPESESIGSDFVLREAEADVDVAPETKYRCRVVATNADAAEDVVGEEGSFTTLEPLEIGSTWVSEVGTETATLNAEVNPLGIPTTGYFQYVEEATYQKDIAELGQGHGFDHATKAPSEPIDFGAGEDFKVGSVAIGGLTPGGTYRYRILATDPFLQEQEIKPKEIAGPIRAFRTYLLGGELPDGRAYELVSPAQKNNADVAVPGVQGGSGVITTNSYRAIQAGASSGDAITYSSWTAFADPKAAPPTSQYLSRRTASGWQTENIFPFGTVSSGAFKPPFRGFSANLGFGAMALGSPVLGEGAEGFDNLYLRDNRTGAFQALTTEAPKLSFPISGPGRKELCLDYAGASEDGSHAFFAANASYAGAPEGPDFSLYEWSAEQGLRPLSVLPGKSTAAAPTEGTSFGAAGPHCQTGESVLRHVVSNDGQRVFWTYAPKSGATQLLVRINNEETVQLDKKVSGTGGSGAGVFLAANVDGSKAFFSDKNKLTSASSEGDLYLYELPGKELKDLTPDSLTPGSEAADVQGVLGASNDGSHVYFVAKGALSGEEENANGEKAESGEQNLYLYREGEGTRFIAVLSSEDERDWSPQPYTLSARVSPDGRHLAFLSKDAGRLAGYDNTVSVGAHCELPSSKGEPLRGSPLCPQAFLYDAEADSLVCASCNPSGARPVGPTSLPGWTNSFEGPRYLSDDGQRLFFESLDQLLPADENEKRDVYEFELNGRGSCSSESPGFDQSKGGCLFLISSGKSADDTYLTDASSDGRDVFFSTRSALVGWDPNGNYDVYDAREGGGLPEPKSGEACEGEACKPPSPPPPAIPSSPGTASFQGPGNAKATSPRCRKGKVRRRGRCVKRGGDGKPRQGKGHGKRNRRAGR